MQVSSDTKDQTLNKVETFLTIHIIINNQIVTLKLHSGTSCNRLPLSILYNLGFTDNDVFGDNLSTAA